MHIVLVTTSYPESQSGSEAAGGFVQEFAVQLSEHARVTVVAAAAGTSSERNEGPVRVRRFGVRRWPLSLLNPLNPLDWWPIAATLRAGRSALQNVMGEDRPDYVFALWALPSGAWARRMQRRFGVPYGIWALGSDIWSLGKVPLLRSYLRTVLRDARHRYADGLQLGSDVETISGRSCEFLPSARRLEAPLSSRAADAPPYRLGFLGRWHPNKGVDLFLEALAQLTADDWANIAEVRIRGGGPLEDDVHGAVAALQAAGRPVNVGGYLDASEAAEFIAWCDYLVLPSRIESIPVIFSDAAQLRRPLVATPVGDLPRLHAENEFGVLAAAATASDIAAALQRALRMPASQFHEQLAAVAEKFDIAVVARDFARRVEQETAS